ncbi:MAG TPA: TRAP transporter fused permease subunit [Pseudothermotoga sp.]|nr:TRAP transporter fused permease subunit [Pseudothermotoga sp.]HOK83832.1 TRAP transporter fused permease subunit [Pseudothermotoga sp.]HPP70265.1 TRAP transporter fused permease subunit [Pseudothermotoga sp.]
MRELKGWQRWFVGVWLVATALFHLYTATVGILQPRLQRGAHLLLLLPMAFILYPATKKSPKDRFTVLDVILAVLSVIPSVYLIVNNNALNMRFERVDPLTTTQIVLGIIIIILLLEAIRRAVVPAMAVLLIVLMGYVYIAPYLPGIFYNKPMKLGRFVEMFYLITDSGIYGSITGISATVVALFVIFGAFLESTGVGNYLTMVAARIAGRGPGGPAKIAVVGSGLFGSISGIAASNVYATGSFTIPMMKKLGYKPELAGAIEAVASTGGIFMPPVMGAAAFIMAELTNIPYVKICVAALLGAIFYYVALGITVHLIALRDGLKGLPKEELPSWKKILKETYLLAPAIGLVYFLVKGYSPFMAAYYSIWISIAISFFKKETMMTPKRIWSTLETSGKNMIIVALACAGAGIVVSVLTYTGLGLGLASIITSLAGGRLLLALILVMVTCLILGMGLPTTPAYIIAVTIAAPALLKMGVDVLKAHLFVLYFAQLSEVTPPVCVASYCGASIAQADPMKVGFESWKLGLTGYIVGYIFIYNDALLMRGSVWQILTIIVLMTLISYLLSILISGYFTRKLKVYERVLTFVILALSIWATATPKFPKEILAIVVFIAGVLYMLLNKFVLKKNEA